MNSTGETFMPDTQRYSPAVESLKKEQRAQAASPAKGDLDKALEDSFPASDPLSITTSTISSGRADLREAERIAAESKVEAANGQAKTVLARLRERVRAEPFQTLGLIAVIAFVCGLTR
jgi:ElaB/YqjD/DUF883 family membrane-anchored ribosome-binding protein